MTTVRATRLLNAIENGTVNSSQLQTLLTTDPSKLNDFIQVINSTKDFERVLDNSPTLNTVLASSAAVTAISKSRDSTAELFSNRNARRTVLKTSSVTDILRQEPENYKQILTCLETKKIATPTNGGWSSPCYGNGIVLIMDSVLGSKNYITSIDGGQTFIPRVLPFGQINSRALSAVFGNGVFMVLMDGLASYYISADAVNWTQKTNLPAITTESRLSFFGGKFILSSEGSTTKHYTTDGTTWAATPIGGIYATRDVCYGNGVYVGARFIGDSSCSIAYSSDGVTYTAVAPFPFITTITNPHISFNGDRFVVVPRTQNGGNPGTQYASSKDGINWQLNTLSTTGLYTSGCAGGYGITAIVTSKFLLTTDGVTLTDGPQAPCHTDASTGEVDSLAFQGSFLFTTRGVSTGIITNLF